MLLGLSTPLAYGHAISLKYRIKDMSMTVRSRDFPLLQVGFQVTNCSLRISVALIVHCFLYSQTCILMFKDITLQGHKIDF